MFIITSLWPHSWWRGWLTGRNACCMDRGVAAHGCSVSYVGLLYDTKCTGRNQRLHLSSRKTESGSVPALSLKLYSFWMTFLMNERYNEVRNLLWPCKLSLWREKRSFGERQWNSERGSNYIHKVQKRPQKFQVDSAGANGMFESSGFVEWKQPSQTASWLEHEKTPGHSDAAADMSWQSATDCPLSLLNKTPLQK